MQSEVSTLTSQNSALVTLESDFNNLQSAIQAVGSAVQGAASASVSNSSALSATASSSALNGTYSIQVDNVGSSTTTLSQAGSPPVTDPTAGNISSSSTFTLTVDGVNTTITPSGDSLEDLATAINSSNTPVQATIVNVGSNASPDYRLSLTSTNLGPDAIQLTDSNNNPLLTTLSTGTMAEYQVNGGSEIQSNSAQLTLAPGLTVNLLQPTTSPVTVTVSSNYSGLSTALGNVATAYNQAVTDLSQQVGQNGGALSGQSIVYELENTLSTISLYTGPGTGTVNGLSDLGLVLGQTGQLTFDASTFSSANISDVQQFLGNTTTTGFLDAANNALTAVTDPNTGMLQTESDSIQNQITSENSQIAEQQVLINSIETNLQAQLSQADASIAALQAQTSYYTQLFNADNTDTNESDGSSSS
jgi:flagellar hook-associated protein 2